MGVLNVTPDSFYDGGRYTTVARAVSHALAMQSEGAHIIDVGGESTRPGACPVPVSVELERVIPVIKALKSELNIPVSVDTRHLEVMQSALEAGADMVNDVSGLSQSAMIYLAGKVPICIMHMQGEPHNMQEAPYYEDVVEGVFQFFQNKVAACCEAGFAKNAIWLDPGFGFGKNLSHNLALLGQLSRLKSLGCPLLIGLSRKSMFGAILNKPVEDRLYGTLAGVTLGILNGADMIRTHDVAATQDVIAVVQAMKPYQMAFKEQCNVDA